MNKKKYICTHKNQHYEFEKYNMGVTLSGVSLKCTDCGFFLDEIKFDDILDDQKKIEKIYNLLKGFQDEKKD